MGSNKVTLFDGADLKQALPVRPGGAGKNNGGQVVLQIGWSDVITYYLPPKHIAVLFEFKMAVILDYFNPNAIN